jgi:TfoX/Sxy family transcriptional regulator of competence genes
VPTRPETADRILAALAPAGPVALERMFGEYGLYVGDRFVGAVCDDQLFLKITPGSRALLDESHDAPPYPGAKPHHAVPEARWRDTAWLVGFVRLVASELPAPKPKAPKKAKT